MENIKRFFVSHQGRLVILYEEDGQKHIAECEPIEDVISVTVSAHKHYKKAEKKGAKHCKKCGQAGHIGKTCPN